MPSVFGDAMDQMIEELRIAIPALFEFDEYREKHRAIDTEFEEEREEAFEALAQEGRIQNATILRTPMGFALAPTTMDRWSARKSSTCSEGAKKHASSQDRCIEKDLAGLRDNLLLSEKRRIVIRSKTQCGMRVPSLRFRSRRSPSRFTEVVRHQQRLGGS